MANTSAMRTRDYLDSVPLAIARNRELVVIPRPSASVVIADLPGEPIRAINAEVHSIGVPLRDVMVAVRVAESGRALSRSDGSSTIDDPNDLVGDRSTAAPQTIAPVPKYLRSSSLLLGATLHSGGNLTSRQPILASRMRVSKSPDEPGRPVSAVGLSLANAQVILDPPDATRHLSMAREGLDALQVLLAPDVQLGNSSRLFRNRH